MVSFRTARSLVVIVLVLATNAARASESSPPTGVLQVAYRQREDAKLSESVHLVELFCYGNHLLPKSFGCRLTTVTVNRCLETNIGKGFLPKVEQNSTDDENLKIVEWERDHIVLQEPISSLGTGTLTYRFEFKTPEGLSTPTFGHLTGFSGGATKTAILPTKAFRWELVPLSGISSLVPLACPAYLPGVPTAEEERHLR